MSRDWVSDVDELQKKFQFYEAVDKMDDPTLMEFFHLRLTQLQEEVDEIRDADSPKEILDGLVDLTVFAIGSMLLFRSLPYEAWDEVHAANMAKEPGVKEGRPNPLGLPDLIKPPGWKAPSVDQFTGNTLQRLFD